MTAVLARMLQEKDADSVRKSERIAQWVIEQALTAESDRDRWDAINWIWDKIDGPTKQDGNGAGFFGFAAYNYHAAVTGLAPGPIPDRLAPVEAEVSGYGPEMGQDDLVR